MKIYMAPMEGITGYIYRNAYNKNFTPLDKYFTPFIQNKGLSSREKEDILPEHNAGMKVVPQVLSGDTDTFFEICRHIKDYGYDEINLNLGCPYGTVVTKKHGAGFLSVPDELDRFFDSVFCKCDFKLSIKTRIGMEEYSEWERLVAIYAKYPFEEIIIHPRLRKDFYNNSVNTDAFSYACERLKVPVSYNGDVKTVKAFYGLKEDFPDIMAVMIGRGIISDPYLADRIAGSKIDERKIISFHNDILEGYKGIMSGDMNTLFKMKEMWFYLKEYFLRNGDKSREKIFKRIKKATKMADYEACVRELFTQINI